MKYPAAARGATVLTALLVGVVSVPALHEAAGDGGAVSPGVVAVGTASVAPAAVGARQVDAPDVEEPSDRILPGDLEGGRVLATAPERVPDIARRSGVDTEALVDLLRDDTVWVTPQGRAYVRERQPVAADRGSSDPSEEHSRAESAAAEPATAQSTSGEPLGATPALLRHHPTSQTFALQSRPGASRTIYIDADGANVSGTAWNEQLPAGTWAGFNEQGGSAATLSDYEHAWIQEVWRQVAEAYAPFDVNVTTLDAGSDAWQRRTATDETWGSRVVVTTSSEPRQVLCGGCLGVAFIGSFGSIDRNAQYQPAWVFASPTMTPTVAAQAVSHEVGHNLGLGHDGSGTSEYTFGTTLWGPIMGGASHRAVSQWSRGEYTGATNAQDDVALIADRLPLRPDDHGGSLESATALAPAASYDVEGLIGSRSDVDVLRLDLACSTTLDARATGIGAQTTLDLALALLGADGTVLESSAPAAGTTSRAEARSGVRASTGMDAALVRALEPGTYYLRVDGVGHGTASQVASMNGWNDYGSLGHYRVTAAAPGCEPTPTTPSASSSPTGTPTDAPTGSPSSPPAVPSPSADPSDPAGPADPVVAPAAPRTVSARSGSRGGQVSATVRWHRPQVDGGSPVTGYRIAAYRLGSRDKVLHTLRTALVPGELRSVQVLLPRGRYRFAVQAVNEAGSSRLSTRSNVALAR